MNPLIRRLLALAALVPLLHAAPAAAYVRYRTDAGLPFYWPQNCIAITAYPESLIDLTADQSLHAAQQAADAWSAAGDACTYMNIQVTNAPGTAPSAKYDGHNNLVYRVDSWCKATDPAGTCSYDRDALAITSVFVSTRDGKIRDGDIEVNAKYFVWTDVDLEVDGGGRGEQDLQNALTHEMGHLIGLDHTCFSAGAGLSRPVDNLGNPAPDCGDAPEAVRATTMFASAVPGDVSKRSLAPDDQLAVCEMYPAASDPMVCPVAAVANDPGCGCGVAARGAPGPGAGLAALAAVGLLAARARRRRT